MWKELFIDDLVFPAVRDAPAVEGKRIAAVFVKEELLCEREDAHDGAAAGKHDFLPVFLYVDQRLKSGR